VEEEPMKFGSWAGPGGIRFVMDVEVPMVRGTRRIRESREEAG
jgi:hypothetical protein